MATDQESNNLDDFDIEQVINWEEHNYASKNLEIQQLPDLELPTDLPVSAQVALPGNTTTVSHGRTILIGSQVLGSHQQPTRDQNASVMPLPEVASSSRLNPVFPHDASCMISDIRQELSQSARVPSQSSRHVEPAFPSENFDLPSIRHHAPLATSAAQSMSYMTGRSGQVPGQQLGRTMTRHQSLHNGIQSFGQANLPQNLTNMPVNEPLNQSMDNVGGGDSIDQLIEDIVDRDMPQGVGEPVAMVFPPSSRVPLSNQHVSQQMHHVIAQSNPIVGTSQRSSSPNQMAAMVRSPSSAAGSPLAGNTQICSGKPMGANIQHANSPLSQNPASPIMPVKVPSPQMQQYKKVTRASRGSKKTTKLIPSQQQQPHSPQNMGMVHSPMQTSQQSPQQAGNAQSPPSSANAINSQNIPSPMSQMTSLGTSQNMSSQVMGNISMQHSPAANSPLNVQSPQNQRPSRQASPGLCNMGSPLTPAQDYSNPQSLLQSYNSQGNPAKVNVQKQNNSQNNPRPQQGIVTPSNVVKTQGNVLHNPVSTGLNAQNTNAGNLWTQNQFISTQLQQRQSNNIPTQGNELSHGQPVSHVQPHVNVNAQANASLAQQRNVLNQPVSTFDTAAVLRGLTALKGSNVLPVSINQQAGTQQLQALKLPGNAANMDFLKQAMLQAGGQEGGGLVTGKPLSLNTSQGQVFYYILPKGTNINSMNGPGLSTSAQQQVKMVLINTSAITGNNSVKTVKSTGSATLKPTTFSSINTNNSIPSPSISQTVLPTFSTQSFVTHQNPMEAMSSVVRAVGNDNVTLTTASINNPIVCREQGRGAINSHHEQHSTLSTNFIDQLVSGQIPGNVSIPLNPSPVQSAGTTQITFVNESTSVDHLVSAPGLSQFASNIISTQPLTPTVSTTVTKTAAIPSVTPSPTYVDSDDSDTPLAFIVESLKRASVEERKKKKKRKGEKRKKKEKNIGPEKPLSAKQIFFKETQAAIRQQNPSAEFGDVSKIVGNMWDNLPEDHKKVYHVKQEKSKAEYLKAMEEYKVQKVDAAEPSPKFRKQENQSAALTTPSHKAASTISTSVTMTTTKEPVKQESITLKIPKSVLNKTEPPAKIPKLSSTGVPSKVTSVSASSSLKLKKSKMSINPISQRMCIREGCNMPARTTKERGTQYCSNDCIVAHCSVVFKSWVTKRKSEVEVS